MGRITEIHFCIAVVTMITVSIGGEINLQLTLMHGCRKAKLT